MPKAPSSWTDPRIIAELVKNCAFAPEDFPWRDYRKQRREFSKRATAGVLSCSLMRRQSCVYDPCFEDKQERCQPRCIKTCDRCGEACAATCETCKRSCPDDACREQCAKGCGECHQGCLRTLDRCSSGVCTVNYQRCRKKRREEWISSGCRELCNAHQRCVRRCDEKHPHVQEFYKVCVKPCLPKSKPKNCSLDDCIGP